MRKIKIKILPNDKCKTKWYYKEKHKNLISLTLTVTELDDEPVFKNCYRYDNGSLFIDKEDCIIIK
jgi:hypothetical protein